MSGYRQTYDQWRADPQAFWAKAAREISWIRAPETDLRPRRRRLRPLVPRRPPERLLQRARPPCRSRPRRPGGALLRQPRHRNQADDQLPRTARRDGDARRGARGSRRRRGRPRPHLHADDSRGDRRDAGLRAHRRGAFGGVRRLRRQGAGDPHRRRRAQGRPDRELRHRARPHRRIQAAARSGDRPLEAQAESLHRLPAAADRGAHERGPRPRLERAGRRGQGGRQARALRRTRRDRPALHPLHLRNDRRAQGRGARHRRLSRRAQMVDVGDLRRRRPARPTGRPPTSAGWSAIPTSSTRRCCMAARACSTKASRSARPTPAPSGG